MKILERVARLIAEIVLVSLVSFTLPSGAFAQEVEYSRLPKRLVGDYGYWSRTQNPPYSSAEIPFGKLTHINHAGVSFDATGALVVPDGFLEPELIRKAHGAGVRVLLLLGGDFPALETPGVLGALVWNLDAFIRQNGYDGVDIDWEYPASSADRSAFLALFEALRQTFPSPEYVLSADVPPWGGWAYDFPRTQFLVNYFNIMMYDCAGPWTDDAQLNSPVFTDPHNPEPWECSPGGSAQQAADIYLIQYGIPALKLNMGTPFYGYLYENVSALWGSCTNCANTVLSENYGTFIKQRINKLGWRSYYDPYALVPYMLRADGKPGFITYDDSASTWKRITYSVWERGLGGSFMWSLDADYDGHSQDLLDAMYNASIFPWQNAESQR
jgi:chitinase